MLAKNTADGDAFSCSFIVSGSLVINRVATGSAFVSIMHVATGARLGAADLPKKENVAMGLTAGLAVTLTSGATAALGFGFPPKTELRAVKGAYFASAMGFAAFDCFVGDGGVVSAGSCIGKSFFVAGGVGAAGLRTGAVLVAWAAAALGLPPNREPKASREFTLASTTGGAANGFLTAAVSSLCVASGFLTTT